MQDLNDLFYFVAVVDHAGFAPAARALNLPKSSLSRRVARLEDRLGVRLIERSTRRFAVTEVGREFHRHAQAALVEARAAEEAALQVVGEPRGVVRVSAPVTIAQGMLARVLPAFLERYPQVRVQMTVTNRRIDLINEGVDVALRVREVLDTDADLKVRILGHDRAIVVASPVLVAERGMPQSLADLEGWPTLSHTESPGRQTWRMKLADGGHETLEHEPRLVAGDFELLIRMAASGAGAAYVPLTGAVAALRSGEIIDLFPERYSSEGILHLVFTSRRGQLPAVSAFIDFMAEELPAAMKHCEEAARPPDP